MTTAKPVGVCLLGSTGSIGLSTLDVIARHPRRFRVIALTANSSVDKLVAQCVQFQPQYAVMADADAANQLAVLLKQSAPDVQVLSGTDGLLTVAGHEAVDFVMAAIVGAAGLLPSLEAARTGKRVMLANKEALVMSGALFMQAVRDSRATLLPVDSEHNAILQCLPDNYVAGAAPVGVRNIMLTASGGPFRNLPVSQLSAVTPEQACAHPTWDMGRKISVDSATMMNKGLEVIEAGWLFGLPMENINVVLHRQSLVHSLVEYNDGSVLAQMGNPDMRIPISHALGWPERIESGARRLDLMAVENLQFEAPDKAHYPCLELATTAWRSGGTAPAILNAANEVAVQAFLDERIAFTAIAQVVEQALEQCAVHVADRLDTILADDAHARAVANEYIDSGKVRVAQ
ncbi:MAG: 1-deoxy-D-xylulose-5-phosphate reductoisomerase [Gammaproteobacteria bacterium]|nr:1-deoxy-D-xylulose-5-phosphate reductoisomerase [Gammaproteobacteria bacterium]MDH3887575.1 1-deoxy-D-xylulose-5-phosphate reductoisomerase [Gammaproteobacteria bacterium]MDH3933716.1 1-deoxy-D-xylulose-5-phosphate reductoisomerase [Gammaproteobacteria bacterium]